MPYIGNSHNNVGEHVNNFKVLDDISSYTATFDGSATGVVSTTNETIRVADHRFLQGQRVTYNNGGGSNIGGLTSGTAYYISLDTANTVKLATSLVNANNNTVINLSSVGSGSSHTLTAAFDGVNKEFKLTYGTKAAIVLTAPQLNIAINNVIQRPNLNPLSFTEGFAVKDGNKIIFQSAPQVNDVFWGSITSNSISVFDVEDNAVDNFTGDGSTTNFTLSAIPPNKESILVTLDGVVQHPSDNSTTRAYTIDASVVVFTSAPASGVLIQVRHIGFASPTTPVRSFYGRTGNVTLNNTDDIVTRNINSSGIITASSFSGSFSGAISGTTISATSATFSGDVSIGGTLTYEDVKNVDSVGFITARSGILVQDDATFTGAVGNMVFDKSDSALEFGDNLKASFGTDTGLQIYHNGSSSFIEQTTSGKPLHIKNNGDLVKVTGNNRVEIFDNLIRLRSRDASETFMVATLNSSVDLYHDNDKKFETSEKGIQVGTGVTIETNGQATFAGVSTFTGHSQFDEYIRIGNPGQLSGSNWGSQIGRGAGATRPASLTFNHGGSATLELGSVVAAAIIGTNSHGANDKPIRFMTGMNIGTLTGGSIQMEIKNNAVNIFNDLDVDGHTNLDNVSVAGVTTFTNSAGVADFKPIQLEKSGTTGASRIQFLENGTNKGGITYSHDNNRVELIAMSGDDIVFYSGGNLTTRINSSGHVVPGTDSTYDLGLTGTRWRNVYTDHISVAGISTAIRYDVNFVNAEIKLTTNQSSFSRYGRINHYHNNGTTEHNAIQFSPRNGATGRMMFYNQVGGTVTERLRIDGTDGIQPSAHIIPMTDSTYNLGSNGTRFANVYADTLYGNGANLTGIDTDLVSDTSPQLGGDLDTNSFEILLDDNHAVKFGNNTDLTVLHSGTTGVINNVTGDLHIKTTSSGDDIVLISNDDIELQPQAGQNGIKVIGGGACELYHNNVLNLKTNTNGVYISTSADQGRLRFADTSGNIAYQITGTDVASSGETGGRMVVQDALGGMVLDFRTAGGNIFCYNTIKLNGNAASDNLKLVMGAGEDYQLYHDGNYNILKGTGAHSTQFWTNNTPRWRIQSTGHLMPEADGTYSVGTSSYRLSSLYAKGVISNIFTNAGTSTQAEFRNEHSVYGGGVRFRSNNTYGTLEIINYNATASASIYNSTGGWHWTGNWQTHGAVLPWTNAAYTLGTSSKRWTTVHSTGLNVSGGTTPATITHTGGNALTLTRSSKNLNFNANYGAANTHATIDVTSGMELRFQVAGSDRVKLDSSGHWLPTTNNARDLGSTSLRWRNVYTNDLNLSNEGKTNDVDGTWGSYTIQEGEDDLFLINKRSGKKYKFNLTEVS